MMEIQHLHLELSLCQIYPGGRQLIHREVLQQIQPMLLLMEHQILLLVHYHLRTEREQLQIIHYLAALTQASVTQKVLGLTGSRIYNATTTASSTDLSLTGLVGSETLTLSGSGTLTSSAVGTGKTITLNTLAISNNSGLASNYDLSGTATMNVTTRAVTVDWVKSL